MGILIGTSWRWQKVKRAGAGLLGLVVILAVVLSPAQIQAQTGAVRLAITRDEGWLNPYTYQTGFPGWNIMTRTTSRSPGWCVTRG
jgi:hypothetical protein